jgi:hypothetical protein
MCCQTASHAGIEEVEEPRIGCIPDEPLLLPMVCMLGNQFIAALRPEAIFISRLVLDHLRRL